MHLSISKVGRGDDCTLLNWKHPTSNTTGIRNRCSVDPLKLAHFLSLIHLDPRSQSPHLSVGQLSTTLRMQLSQNMPCCMYMNAYIIIYTCGYTSARACPLPLIPYHANTCNVLNSGGGWNELWVGSTISCGLLVLTYVACLEYMANYNSSNPKQWSAQ